jgi:hypothetical protein
MNQMKSNSKNSISFFTRFLGLNTDCVDQLNLEEKFIFYKLVPLENKKLGVQVTHGGEDKIFTIE